MALSSVIQKTVRLSPKLVVPIAFRGINIGTSRGSLLLAPTTTRCFWSDSEDGDKKDKLTFSHTNKVFEADDLNLNGNIRVSDPVLLNYINFRKSDSNNLSYVNLGGFPFQVQECSNGVIFTRNVDPQEEIKIQVNMSCVESSDYKPIPFILFVTREYEGVKYENQFLLYISKKEIVVDNMRIMEKPSLDIGLDDSIDVSSDDSSDEAETKCVDKNIMESKEYTGPDFKELDDCWQKEIHTYLESRGIKPDMFSSLKDYIFNKRKVEASFRDYVVNKKKMEASSTWKSKFMEIFLR